MIIEVDAPLRRSHYDWFWSDEGRGEGLARSSRSHKTQAGEPLEKHRRQQTARKETNKCLSVPLFFFSMIVL